MAKLRFVRLLCSKCKHTEQRRVQVDDHKVPVAPQLCEKVISGPPEVQCGGAMTVY